MKTTNFLVPYVCKEQIRLHAVVRLGLFVYSRFNVIENRLRHKRDCVWSAYGATSGGRSRFQL